MKIDILVVGDLEENCYIVTKNNKTIIIDPGDEAQRIIDFCKNLNVVEVLITHHHFDHIGALKEIENYFNIKENEVSGYFNYEIIKTPGHTNDSISYFFKEDNVLFSGDFIFNGTIGRMDLPTGSISDMKDSLKLINRYNDNIIIYPGHGNKTTLGKEKNNFKYYL